MRVASFMSALHSALVRGKRSSSVRALKPEPVRTIEVAVCSECGETFGMAGVHQHKDGSWVENSPGKLERFAQEIDKINFAQSRNS